MSKEEMEDVKGLSEEQESENGLSGQVPDNSADEPADTPADRLECDALKIRVQALETEIADLKDQNLRKQADFENFRKRMIRDKEDSIKYGNADLLKDLIEIIDDFERAIKSSSDSKDSGSFHTGIELIEKQFVGMLERNWGLVRFESLNEEFDPEKHEAIAMTESPDQEIQTVLEEFQKGFMLHDRVLRHAKVRVSMPVSIKEEEDSGKTAKNNEDK